MNGHRPEDILPLSPLQEGLLFHAMYAGEARDPYAVQFVFSLKGRLDVVRLRKAAEALLARHANLRAGFKYQGLKRPVQIISSVVPLAWTEASHVLTDAAQQDEWLAHWLEQERAKPFDLEVPPLLRFAIVAFGSDEHRLVLTVHHIILDGWSIPILIRELLELYEADGDASGMKPVVPYKQYLKWLAKRDRTETTAAWKEELSGVDGGTLLAPERTAADIKEWEQLTVEAPAQLVNRLASYARSHHLTLNSIIQCAWGVLLGRLTGRNDVIFGITVSGRPADIPGVDRMIGLFINTVPVRVRFRPDDRVGDVLQALQATQARLLEHQYISLMEVQQLAGVGELFDTLIVYRNYPAMRRTSGTNDSLVIEPRRGFDGTHYPLSITVVPGNRLWFRFTYSPSLFRRADVEDIGRRLERVLATIAEDDHKPIGAIDVLTHAEKHRLGGEWNDTDRAYPAACVDELLERQAERSPSEVACTFGNGAVTYSELDERANRLAHHLRRYGVGPEVPVGLCMERGLSLVVAMLAIWKAGGAYVGLDPAYPGERLAFMLADSGARMVLTNTAARSRVPEVAPVLDVEREWPVIARESSRRPPRLTTAGNLAYIYYTSGSTGRPKGVAVPHAGISNYIQWGIEGYRADGGIGAPVHSSMAVDLTLTNFVPLFAGKRIHIVPEGPGAEGLIDLLTRESGWSLVKLTPSHLKLLNAELTPPQMAAATRVLVVGADNLMAEPVVVWRERAPEVTLINEYGPTETVVGCSTYTIPRDSAKTGRVPIGRPIANIRMYVLDALGDPLPAGVAGELYIGGIGVARGYWNQPSLTAAKFVPDPFDSTGTDRLYRTGDRVRRLVTGDLEFLGRVDHQVKIRGYRVELAEIEAVLREQGGVREALVVVREDQPGVKRLVGYVVAAPGNELDVKGIKNALGRRLPDYMVPGAVVRLPRLPLGVSGKLDLKLLPPVETGEQDLPRTRTEEILCGLMAEVLGVSRVGVDESFFELGGDSIMSIQLANRARAAGIPIRPADVFQQRTVAKLAAVAGLPAATVAEDEATGEVIATPMMRALAERGGPVEHFRQVMAWETPGGMQLAQVRAIMGALVAHHDALRMRVRREAGAWRLWIEEAGAVDGAAWVTRVPLAGLDGAERAARMREAGRAAGARLAPAYGVMVQAVWGDAGAEPGRLLLAIHHFAVDGVSWRIVEADLQTAWTAVAAGRPVALGPKGTSFRRWTHALQTAAAARPGEGAYWQAMAGATPRLFARELDAQRDTAGGARHLSVTLPAPVSEAVLTAVPKAFHAEINDVLLTGLAVAVANWARQAVVQLDLEGHGREEAGLGLDVSRTVGWFTTVYPVRLDLSELAWEAAAAGGAALGQACKAIKEQLRRVPDKGLGYGLLRYLNPTTAAALAGARRPELGFNYLGRFGGGARGGAWTLAADGEALRGGEDAALPLAHAVEVNALARETAAGWQLTAHWTWAPAVAEEASVRALATAWGAVLERLAAHVAEEDAGGHTPSDLELVSLTQDEIDLLEREDDDGLEHVLMESDIG